MKKHIAAALAAALLSSAAAAEKACPVQTYGELASALEGVADRSLAATRTTASPSLLDDADFLRLTAACLRRTEREQIRAINRLLAPVIAPDPGWVLRARDAE